MYLHIGMDTVINTDSMTLSYKTRDFLSEAEKSGKVISVCSDLPKSFIVCRENEKQIIYICQLSPMTLLKRTGID